MSIVSINKLSLSRFLIRYQQNSAAVVVQI